MKLIDKMYFKEKHFNLKYYDTLKLAMLLHLEYEYSYKKSSDEILKDLRFKKNEYTSDELKEMINNAFLILKIQYNIQVIQDNPLVFKKIESEWFINGRKN